MKLLIVEDDQAILAFLKRGFSEDGHSVDVAEDGADAEYLAGMHHYDVIVLDWMLPEKSGLEVIEALRQAEIHTPVILLTAKADIEDKIAGLRGGADDYLTKPFVYAELLARVEALHRRVMSDGSNSITLGEVTIDTYAKTVLLQGKNIPMTKKEYELLLFLMQHHSRIISSQMIEEQLWSQDAYVNSNVIQVTVYNIRKKLGKERIRSYRGLGYKFEA